MNNTNDKNALLPAATGSNTPNLTQLGHYTMPVMTEAANGASYTQHIEAGWTHDQLINNGLMYPIVMNQEFLKSIFGKEYPNALVTSFSDDPSKLNHERGGLCWSVGLFSEKVLIPNTNQFFCVSLFKKDKDGRSRRQKALFTAQYCVVLDDVEEKLSAEQAALLPKPSWILRTSNGSYQWGFILTEPCHNRKRLDNLYDGLIKSNLAPDSKDPGMRGVTRLMRLPQGVNSKAKRVAENGGVPPRCVMTAWNPDNKYSIEQLAAPFKINLDATRTDSVTKVGTNVSMPNHPIFKYIHLKREMSHGKYDITCPWVNEHSDGADNGAAIFMRQDGSFAFYCHHGHCDGRTHSDVIAKLMDEQSSFEAEHSKFMSDILFSGVSGVAMEGSTQNLSKLPDSKLSEQLAKILKSKLIYDDLGADWYNHSSSLWSRISKNKALRLIYDELLNLLPDGLSNNRINNIEKFLQLHLGLEKWENCKHLLPLENGVLDVRTMELSDYSHECKFAWQLPYEYDPDATMTVFPQWLQDSTCNNQELVDIIRAFFKVTLTGSTVQKFLEVTGVGGTGKSTLVRILIMLVGERNHRATDLKNLETNRFETAALYGKKLAVISDSSRFGGEVTMLKNLTGGDPVRFEKKNQQQQESFIFEGSVVIISNEPVQSSDYTSGFARRRLPVLFNNKIRDVDMAKWQQLGGIEKAIKSEMPGILNWVLSMSEDEVMCVIGNINGELNSAEREHLCATNKIAAWLDDNLVLDPDSILYCGASSRGEIMRFQGIDQKLYPNYEQWCLENKVNPIGLQRFTPTILDICSHVGIPVKKLPRSNRGVRLQGLKIRSTLSRETSLIKQAVVENIIPPPPQKPNAPFSMLNERDAW